MPGNTIKINNHDFLEWYVGDSKMEELLTWLEENALKTDDSNVLNLDQEITKMKLLDQWIEELVYPGNPENFVHEGSAEGEPGKIIRRFYIYTNKHEYNIVAIADENDNGYLGCHVSTRKPRAGENWVRGNDLPDGPFNRNTWDKIINAIVKYELVKLSNFVKPAEIPKEVA